MNRLTPLSLAALVLAACTTAEEMAAAEPFCTAGTSPTVIEVRAARTAFNQAIADKDIAVIAVLLAPDVTLVTGTDSTRFNGREAQVSIWQEDFEAAERAIYIRTTDCVSISPLLPIALETGTWRGTRTDDPQSFAAGIYSAKWREVEGAWQLEAEIFATTSCGASMCPEEPAP
ncbi:MAG: nuclear transport factor 2 family protein [Henriciella sp.]